MKASRKSQSQATAILITGRGSGDTVIGITLGLDPGLGSPLQIAYSFIRRLALSDAARKL
jgi:hypothetical protein